MLVLIYCYVNYNLKNSKKKLTSSPSRVMFLSTRGVYKEPPPSVSLMG